MPERNEDQREEQLFAARLLDMIKEVGNMLVVDAVYTV